MAKIVVTHEVDDVAHWLASPMRAQVLSGIATNLTEYVLPGGSNQVALSMDVADMDALRALLQSETGAKAMKHDGVRPATLLTYIAN